MEPGIQAFVDSVETWQSSREVMRQRCAAWIRSPEFLHVYYYDVHPPSVPKEVIEKEVGKEAAAQVLATIELYGGQSRELWEAYQQLATHGQVVFAHAVIVNPSAKKPPAANRLGILVLRGQHKAGYTLVRLLFERDARQGWGARANPLEHCRRCAVFPRLHEAGKVC